MKVLCVMCSLILLYGVFLTSIEVRGISKFVRYEELGSVTFRGQSTSMEIGEIPPSSISIDMKLKLEVRNNGVKPVILLKERSPTLVGYILTRNDSKATSDNQLAFSFTGPSVNTSREWVILRESIDQPAPRSDKFRILTPNETWSFDDSVRIFLSTEAGNKSVFPKNASWETVRDLSPVWLRVIYEVWPLNIEPPSRDRTKLRFGRKLQKRWENDGFLLLTPLYSDPIKLDLQNIKQGKVG
jgi:hypothetical protein